jgi:hypothetical protein
LLLIDFLKDFEILLDLLANRPRKLQKLDLLIFSFCDIFKWNNKFNQFRENWIKAKGSNEFRDCVDILRPILYNSNELESLIPYSESAIPILNEIFSFFGLFNLSSLIFKKKLKKIKKKK